MHAYDVVYWIVCIPCDADCQAVGSGADAARVQESDILVAVLLQEYVGLVIYLSCTDFGDGVLELLLEVTDVVEGERGEVVAGVPPDARLQLVHLVLHPCHLQ